jgi:arylsulfatase A-like enzyme
MLAYGPGFEGGKVINELVSLIDIAPTILKAGGVQSPEYMRGRPLQQLVDGKAEDWPREIFAQISESHCGRAIRTKKWKYSVVAPDKGGNVRNSEVYVEDFLYDLENDPHERTNLVEESAYTNVRAELAEILKSKMVEAGEKEPEIQSKV